MVCIVLMSMCYVVEIMQKDGSQVAFFVDHVIHNCCRRSFSQFPENVLSQSQPWKVILSVRYGQSSGQ